MFVFRISGRPEIPASIRRAARCHQEQKASSMAEDTRADHGKVPGTLCHPAEESCREGRLVPIQEHLPKCEFKHKVD